ncbi:hypothetical protein MMC18_000041 [Xylographa bjoerkii]|nr:hypothetical protein [Xylographa bjoerkii]
MQLSFASTAPTYAPIQPPSYPLAVRNPYLSVWMPGLDVADLPSSTPQFWAGNNLTWGIMARVEGTPYSLMGVPVVPDGTFPAVVTGAEYTSTHTIFNLTAENASFSLDFFSPVSPSNYVRQSYPFSYLTINAEASIASSIQIYVDFDETWTGQTGATVSNFTTTEGVTAFDLSVTGAYTYSENGDQALWGNAILACVPSPKSNLSSQSGSSATVRGQFAANGTLANLQPIYSPGDVAAIANDLGIVMASTSVTYVVGYAREEAVNYLGNAYTGYYRSLYADPIAAVSAFFADLALAYPESLTFDASVLSKSMASAGSNYSDITTLSVRQAFGALDITIPNDSLDTDGILVFLKEISSDGNVNTMDVIYPTFPILYVMDPEYIRLLLEPVMQYLATGSWQQPYVIHDIGDTYPNATGHNDQNDESQPIEETGNLLILAYAYTRATANTTFSSTYAPLFQSYADYLVANGLNISSQLSTDDGAGALPNQVAPPHPQNLPTQQANTTNQTNLAIKAAIGLTAYGAMSGMANYTAVGLNYSNQLYEGGLGTDTNRTHFTLEYGNDTTWTTAFNLFPSVLLNLSTFSEEALAMQTAWYPTVRAQAGVPLDSRVDWGKTDWMHFAAAYATDVGTKDMFIDDVHAFVSEGLPGNQVPFSDRYFVANETGGAYDGYRARPVVGGHFAVLALEGPATVGGAGNGEDVEGSERGCRGPCLYQQL